MKRLLTRTLLALVLLSVSCTKEEDAASTQFTGTVRLSDGDGSFADAEVEVYGMARNPRCFLFCDDITKLNKVYPVEPDGSFSIQVTTEEVDYFRLGIRVRGERRTSECLPGSMCMELRPGTRFSGLLLSVVE